jgi:hypothetical protein
VVEAFENFLNSVKRGVLPHGHGNMKYPVKRSFIVTVHVKENVAQSATDGTSEKVIMSAAFDGVFDDAVFVKGMITAGEGKSERTFANAKKLLKVTN